MEICLYNKVSNQLLNDELLSNKVTSMAVSKLLKGAKDKSLKVIGRVSVEFFKDHSDYFLRDITNLRISATAFKAPRIAFNRTDHTPPGRPGFYFVLYFQLILKKKYSQKCLSVQ